VLQNVNAVAGPGLADLGGKFNIGARDDPTNFLTGTVDEVAVYSTTLSAARIRAHYLAGVNVEELAGPILLAGQGPL